MKRHGEFEWDDEKARTNLAKHSVTFEDAVMALTADRGALERTDSRFDYREIRRVTLARIDGRLLSIVWTARGEHGAVTRIISARRANRGEIRKYEQRN